MSVKHDQQSMHVHVEAARQPRACVSMALLMLNIKGHGSVEAYVVPYHAQRCTRGVSIVSTVCNSLQPVQLIRIAIWFVAEVNSLCTMIHHVFSIVTRAAL